ncbi:MAG: hypothetical protein QOK37_3124 [Thermoanaerobaculia bacterium]|jgi:hypothetical protein|nr:hypothetical protein [Thermoanaerobaculia bacterium]
MSHSRRKTPIRGVTTSESEKSDKVQAHRRIRRRIHAVISSPPDAEVLPHDREMSNPWLMAKDGKQRFDRKRDRALLRK